VSLDVANAFNSANWDIIVKALRNKGVPEYLRNIIQDYLNNRYLIYGVGKKRKVTCGAPQGSVLGPTLWNIMYDDLLQMDLNTQRLGLTGHSSAGLVAFADDVTLTVTGRTTDILEDRANEALEKVSTWMKANDLKLAVDKTECVMLTKKRGYKEPIFTLNGTIVQPKESFRYLGIELSKILGYRTHIQAAAVKAGKTASALQRILPNVRGARQCKRRIMASTVQNQLLYGAQIWAGALRYENNVNTLLGPQRQMTLRVAMAYRTVSTQAIMVVAGMIPVHLLAKERQRMYIHTKEGKEVNKQDHRANTYKEWQKEWDQAKKGRWTHRLIQDVEKWSTRGFGNIDYHLTQMIIGHGCFGSYLYKYKKRLSPECVDCKAVEDSAEHTIFVCDRWWNKRRDLEVKVGGEFEVDSVIKLIIRSRSNWKADKGRGRKASPKRSFSRSS